MDYRELLKKYMQQVFSEESVTFVPNRPGIQTAWTEKHLSFTEEEVAELEMLDNEVRAEA